MGGTIPVIGVLTGLIVAITVFIWLYHEEKVKREAGIEIAKLRDDPAKVERLLGLFDERKKGPIDYRRGGVITLFVGVGVYLLGTVFFGTIFDYILEITFSIPTITPTTRMKKYRIIF